MDKDRSALSTDKTISCSSDTELIKLEIERSLEENQLTEAWTRYRHFEDYQNCGQPPLPISEFISEWSARLNSALAAGCEYSDTVLAFKLLERANLGQAALRQVLVRQVNS
jgi:hypothetical protein